MQSFLDLLAKDAWELDDRTFGWGNLNVAGIVLRIMHIKRFLTSSTRHIRAVLRTLLSIPHRHFRHHLCRLGTEARTKIQKATPSLKIINTTRIVSRIGHIDPRISGFLSLDRWRMFIIKTRGPII